MYIFTRHGIISIDILNGKSDYHYRAIPRNNGNYSTLTQFADNLCKQFGNVGPDLGPKCLALSLFDTLMVLLK